MLFQSTLSVRRATAPACTRHKTTAISIHALREESDEWWKACQACADISIHALREESDLKLAPETQPRLISIHALREESDPVTAAPAALAIPISIHALREESDVTPFLADKIITTFQSTLSVRRATYGYYVQRFMRLPISIHALREESDPRRRYPIGYRVDFNPRSP